LGEYSCGETRDAGKGVAYLGDSRDETAGATEGRKTFGGAA
jgi:hypothetical protein